MGRDIRYYERKLLRTLLECGLIDDLDQDIGFQRVVNYDEWIEKIKSRVGVQCDNSSRFYVVSPESIKVNQVSKWDIRYWADVRPRNAAGYYDEAGVIDIDTLHGYIRTAQYYIIDPSKLNEVPPEWCKWGQHLYQADSFEFNEELV